MAVATRPKITPKVYKPEFPIDWCPGCGDFGIVNAIHQALAKLNIPPHDVAVVGGIGCSGKAQYHVKAYGVHTLHGRPVPYATGIRLANPNLHVIVVSGDGDSMAIGAGHFVNAGRRNVNFTYLMFDNEVYGLTKGQAGPTLPLGLQTKSLPEPNINAAVNPLLLALASGYTWIGRGYAYNIRHLVNLIVQAIQHPGSAFLDILQPCPTYNDLHTRAYYAERTYDLAETGYDPELPAEADAALVASKMATFTAKALEWEPRIPVGIFWQQRLPTFEARLAELDPNYTRLPPAKRPASRDLGPLLAEHRL